MAYTNWKEHGVPFLDFTERLTYKWIGKGFSRGQAKKWLDIGMKATDTDFCAWLRDTRKVEPEWILNYEDNEQLKTKYQEWVEIKKLLTTKEQEAKKTQQKLIELQLQYVDLPNYSFLKKRSLKRQLENYSQETEKITGRRDELKEKLTVVEKRGNVQIWLDKNYPKEERKEAKEIYLNESNLEGELDLGDFTYWDGHYEDGVNIYISPQVDETKLTFKNLPKYGKIILLDAQKWLDEKYPKDGTCIRENEREESRNHKGISNLGKTRSEITELYIRDESLEGTLDLNDFVNLKELDCSKNKLTSLNINNCSHLISVVSYDNLLTNITLPTNPTNLKTLNLKNNNFPTRDLSFLTTAVNLEWLGLGNNDQGKIDQNIYNKFTNSLDCLSSMNRLDYLDINNTDINEVNIDKLPRSLKKIEYSSKKRPDCELFKIASELERHGCELCKKCQQVKTSTRWCQPCADQELKNLTGQELIEKFIQQQQAISSEWDKLKWIPYEQFTDIEFLAEGGFSKVYKATKREKLWSDEGRKVVLKSLISSQSITPELLREIVNTRLVKDHSPIIKCYGISQDPQTKNYVMVMDYKEEGNLRQFLQKKKFDSEYEKKKFKEKLTLKEKIYRLLLTVRGLRDIHWQKLIHRDFHSGNIVENHIIDLGLCRPINYQKEESETFGVIPYVAPEVLQGQSYTRASDIYSFGIIAYELFANAYPYYEEYIKIADEEDKEWTETKLSAKICRGCRPDINKVPIPQLLKDLIKRCWGTDPKQRPSIWRLSEIIGFWWEEINYGNKKYPEFYCQYQALKQEYNTFSLNTPYRIHPTTITTSKLINTQEIIRIFQESEQKALEQEIKKMEKEIGKSLAEQQKKLVSDFIQTRKIIIKDKENEEAEDKVWDLEDKLKEKGLSGENIEKIIRYCERFIESEQQLKREVLQANIEIPTNK